MSASRVMFFFFNDTATTEIYTLSLHDALPIWGYFSEVVLFVASPKCVIFAVAKALLASSELRRISFLQRISVWLTQDRKSTRLNSSHANISYAVFCLKKKKICTPSPLT